MGLFTNETTTTGSPWGPLQEPLLQGVEGMQNAYNAGPWQGPYISGQTAGQTGGINQGMYAAQGAGGVANAYNNAGLNQMGGLGDAFNYYQGALGGSSNPWINNPQPYQGMANNIADNPYVDSQITAALRDPYRDLTENQLPGNALNASMLGQSGGSGREVGDAIAQRGYADRAADVGAQFRGNAYSQGLGMANQAATGDMNAQQNAAGQLGQMGNQGLGYMGQGYGFGQQGAKDQYGWGTEQYNLNNKQIDADMRQFYEPWTLAQNYGNYINPLAGQLQTNNTQQDMLPFYMAQIAGGLGDLGGTIGSDLWGWAKENFGWGGGVNEGDADSNGNLPPSNV